MKPTLRIARIRSFLFHGEALPESTWRVRHRFIRAIIALHVPLLITIAAVLHRQSIGHTLLEAGALVLIVAAASSPSLSRTSQELIATFGMLTCSALFVHVTGGSIEAHFHFFVALPIVSLYQSWPAFIMALGYVVIHHGALGTLMPAAVYNHPAAVAKPWHWALIHAAFVSAASAVFVTIWRINEGARNETRDLYRRLYEGQRGIVHQLEEASRMKDELVSVVSHELRTPLTSILGFGDLLHSNPDASTTERKDWLDRLMRQGERLQFLIENLLVANSTNADRSARCDLKGIVDEVLAEQGDRPADDGVRFEAHIAEDIDVHVAERALRLIVSNLVNNAAKYAVTDTVASIAANMNESASGGSAIELSVSNVSNEISEDDLSRMFGAFVQLDSPQVRRLGGVGLGLYIVRETARAYGGTVKVACDGQRITFTVCLPANRRAGSHAA
jgi:signal transduction histidine kinase